MGCYPLGKIVFKAFGKCSGKERKRSSREVKLSPPPSYLYSCPRTVVRTVNLSNETPNIVIIPPDPKPHPVETIMSTSTCTAKPETIGEVLPQPHGVRSPPTCTVEKEPTAVQPHCYVMSPLILPGYEERPRRREYFSGEYSYYPTPIREGIYKLAADPNRLTTIFSEENPNACTIV